MGVCTSCFSPIDSAAGDEGGKKAHDVDFPSCHVCQKKLGFPGLDGGVNLNLETWAPDLVASEYLHDHRKPQTSPSVECSHWSE